MELGAVACLAVVGVGTCIGRGDGRLALPVASLQPQNIPSPCPVQTFVPGPSPSSVGKPTLRHKFLGYSRIKTVAGWVTGGDVSEPHLESNVLLRSLEPASKARFAQRFQKFELVRGDVLHNLGDEVEWVHFPRHGLVAVMAETVAGESVESGMVGREGALGIFEACGTGQLFTRAVVQVGGEALRLPAASYRELFLESASLRTAVHKYVEFLLLEARQFVLCNALHTVESRLCRAILDTLERSGLDRALPVTQESLAQMLGA